MCVPLGEPFRVYDDNFELIYKSLHNLRLLRNSIFAQYGYPFEDKMLADLLKNRGCIKQDGRDYKKMDRVDKVNVSIIKGAEEDLKINEFKENFQATWNEADSKTRESLLKDHYCYLSDSANKIMGVIFFTVEKQKVSFKLRAMMDTKKLKNKELDRTELGGVVDDATAGTWRIENSIVSIALPKSDIKNSTITVSGEHFKDQEVLNCKLTK